MISLVSVLFGIGGSALILLSFQNTLHQEEKSAIASYRMILNTLQIANNMKNWYTQNDLSSILEQLPLQDASWSAIRLTSEKEVLYSQGETADSMLDLSAQINPTHCACTVFSAPDERYFIQVSGLFYVGNTSLYLDTTYDISSIYENYRLQQRIYLWIFSLLLILCAAFSYILSFFLTRPLMKLAKASKEIADGNYECRSAIHTLDEVGILSKEFDRMADSLLCHIRELKNSMERQERFIGSFTHELKTPMTSIIGYADLLRSRKLSEEDAIDAANYIFSEGKRLEHLSLILLDILVAEQKEIPLVPVSPAQIIFKLVHFHSGQFEEQNITLSVECEKGICLLNPNLFYSLLLNLIENARRSFTDGGKIQITCSMLPDGCRIIVADNGKGIPEDSIRHLTEPFYRVDKSRSRSHGGAGLGLSLCAKIAELHNGSITFESKLQKGTSVFVELKGGRT